MFIKWITRKRNFRSYSSGSLSWNSAGSFYSSILLGLTSSTAKNESGNVLLCSRVHIKIHLKICHFLTNKYSQEFEVYDIVI